MQTVTGLLGHWTFRHHKVHRELEEALSEGKLN